MTLPRSAVLFRVSEAADFMGATTWLPAARIVKAVKAGELPIVNPSAASEDWLVHEADLDAWLEAMRQAVSFPDVIPIK